MIDPNIRLEYATSSVGKPRKSRSGHILAIDFDGTIHDIKHPLPGKRMGEPLPDAPGALTQLANAGNRIIIYSTRASSPSGLKSVQDWLEYYDLPYHDITAVKPNADWFIDDKAIHHTTWINTLAKLGYRPEVDV